MSQDKKYREVEMWEINGEIIYKTPQMYKDTDSTEVPIRLIPFVEIAALDELKAELQKTRLSWADAETRLHEKYSNALLERDELKAELYQKHDVTCPYPDCKRPFWYQQKPNPNMGSAFTVMAKDPPPPKYSELAAKLDELKAENERLAEDFNNTWEHRDQLIRDAGKLTCQVVALTAALRDMVGALEHYSTSYEQVVLTGVETAREVLTKHADLIGKLKGDE